MAAVVDALHEDAWAFFEYQEFWRFSDDPFRLILIVMMMTIRTLLGEG